MITIDHESPTPPYEQLRLNLADRIASGQLAAGTRLPTVRRLATDLGLAVNTVARAYRELEVVGLVQTRGRAGTFVHSTDVATAQAQSAARTFAQVIRGTGLTREQAMGLIVTALDSTAASL